MTHQFIADTKHNIIEAFANPKWEWVILACMVFWSMHIIFSYAMADIRIILDRVTVDDAFYYFEVANNVVAGNGFTFDGINKTNGFQVLWMILILPFFALIHDPITQIRVMMLFSGVFYMLTGLMIFLITKKLFGRILAIFAAYIWILNPELLKIGITGMETSMNAFLTTIFLYFLLFTSQNQFNEAPTKRFTIILGGFIGILTLSRIENALFGPIIACYLIYLLYTKKHSLKMIFKRLSYLTLGFILITGPYFVINQFYFGSLTPINGSVKLFYEKGWLFDNCPVSDVALIRLGNIYPNSQHIFDLVFGKFAQYLDTFLFKALDIVIPWDYYTHISYMIIVGVLVGFAIGGSRSVSYNKWYNTLMLFFTFGLVHCLFVSIVLFHFSYYNTWYYSVEYISLILIFVLSLDLIHRNLTRVFVENWARHVAKLGLVLLIILALFSQYQFNIYRAEELNMSINRTESVRISFYESALWTNDNLPTGSRIGAFSAGILGFFSNNSVVNLDGFINNEEYINYMKSGRFNEYIEDKQIGYIADYFTYDPLKSGVNWYGHLPPEKLDLVVSWPISSDKTYYIFEITDI